MKGNTVEGFSSGIAVTSFFGATDNVVIHENEIRDNDIGVRVGYEDDDFNNKDITGVQVNQNNIVGNQDYGVAHYHGDTVDATYNWWGTDDEVEIEDMVEGEVDYEPWLDGPVDGAGANL